MAVDALRRCDADNLVDRGRDVVDVVELPTHRTVRGDPSRPADRHRIAGAAEVTGDQLGVVEGRISGPCPAGVVHVVGLGRAERIQAAQGVEGGKLILDSGGNSVLRQQFTDAAALAFGAGAVVAEDVDHHRVVGNTLAVQFVEDAVDLDVDVFEEAGEHLHEAPLEGPLLLGDVRPALHGVRARRQLGVGGYPPGGLLPGEDPFAVGVPAVVEGALILIGPFPGDVVGSVGGSGGPIHEERSVGCVGPMPAQPGDGVVGKVLGEVVVLPFRRFDRIEILIQPGLPLRGFAGDEPVEVVEAVPGGPTVEGPHGGRLGGGRVVPFAERRGAVAVMLQDFGDGGGVLADDPGIAVPVHRPFGDRARMHAVVIAPGQQRRPGGRTDRRGVKRVVADAILGYPPESRGTDLTADHIGQAETDIVEQNDDNVGGVVWQMPSLDPTLVRRIGERVTGGARRGCRRERECRPVGIRHPCHRRPAFVAPDVTRERAPLADNSRHRDSKRLAWGTAVRPET